MVVEQYIFIGFIVSLGTLSAYVFSKTPLMVVATIPFVGIGGSYLVHANNFMVWRTVVGISTLCLIGVILGIVIRFVIVRAIFSTSKH